MYLIVNKILIEVWYKTTIVKANYMYAKKEKKLPCYKHPLKTNFIPQRKQFLLPISRT